MKSLPKSALPLFTLALAFIFGPVATSYANEADIKELKATIEKRMPASANASINTTPIKGLFEVIAGNEIMYMTKDARYIFEGDIYDMDTRKNLTENARDAIRINALNQLGEDNMLVYMPKGEVEHTITVFTDIYCFYCRKLHHEMAHYQDNGVKVRYLFLPFKGAKSVKTSISVWCAKDQNLAMDMAKDDKAIKSKTCETPLSKHQALASKFGIKGTPAIVLDSGTMLPGYVPSVKVIAQLNSQR